MKNSFNGICKWLIVSCWLIPLSASAQLLNVDGSSLGIDAGTSFIVQGDVAVRGAGQISNEGNLSIAGNLTNNATDVSNMGQTRFDGTASQSIGGSQSLTFTDLILANAAGLVLSQGIRVDNSLELSDGSLNLNGQLVELSATANLLGETNDKRVFGSSGRLRTVRTLNSPTGDNIANLGLRLTTSANLGSTVIERGHDPQDIGGGGSIARFFEVSPSNNTNLSATVQVIYLPAELNGQSATALALFRLDGNWNNLGGDSNTGSNFVQQTGVNRMGLFTLSADGITNLPSALAGETLLMYPNPLAEGESLQLRGLKVGTYDATLYDAQGRQVAQQVVKVATGSQSVDLPFPKLTAGVYTLRLAHPDFQSAQGKLFIH